MDEEKENQGKENQKIEKSNLKKKKSRYALRNGSKRLDSQDDDSQGSDRYDSQDDDSQGSDRYDSQDDDSQGSERYDSQDDDSQGSERYDSQDDDSQGSERFDSQDDDSQGSGKDDSQDDDSQDSERFDSQDNDSQGSDRDDDSHPRKKRSKKNKNLKKNLETKEKDCNSKTKEPLEVEITKIVNRKSYKELKHLIKDPFEELEAVEKIVRKALKLRPEPKLKKVTLNKKHNKDADHKDFNIKMLQCNMETLKGQIQLLILENKEMEAKKKELEKNAKVFYIFLTNCEYVNFTVIYIYHFE